MKPCEFCNKLVEKTTKHSIVGNHKSPFVRVCRKCHDKIHGMVQVRKNERIKLKKFLLNKLKNESGYDLNDLPLNSNRGLR